MQIWRYDEETDLVFWVEPPPKEPAPRPKASVYVSPPEWVYISIADVALDEGYLEDEK